MISCCVISTTNPRRSVGILGGADRDRTGGLLVANQALSQLSYSPLNPVTSTQFSVTSEIHWVLGTVYWQLILVGLGRIELPTSPLSGVRSSQLSYRPGRLMINQNAPEPKSISAIVIAERSEESAALDVRANCRSLASLGMTTGKKFFEEKVERATRLSPV